jgi:hypothetical protein
MEAVITDAPYLQKDRVKGTKYYYGKEIRTWLGSKWGCEHGNDRYSCKECGINRCEHGKDKYKCRDCGIDICEHGRDKYNCKDCNTGLCGHGKNKYRCKDCKIGFCEHGREKHRCKDCGTGMCAHNRRKDKCKDCGTGMCIHDIRKDRCIICSPHRFCIHSRRKDRCKDCGTGMCIHNRDKHQCKDCGAGMCIHNKLKKQCKDCGKGHCQHNKRKDTCKDCNTGRCIHCKIIGTCHICHINTHPHNFCLNCKYINIRGKKFYKPYCFRCFCYLNPDKISRRYMMKENYIDQFLKTQFPNINIIHNKTTGGCSLYRPDWYIDRLTHVIVVECDEDCHSNYSCENKRIMSLFQDFANRPLVVIRFNPDKYKEKECFTYDDKNKILS